VAASSSSNGKLIMKEGKTPKKLAANDLPYEEPTYSVSEHTERVIQVCILYLFLMTFVVAETSGFCDNFVEKHIFVMRFLLISTLTSFLMPILATAFEHPPGSGGLVQFVIIMALGCLMCVFEVHRISAITAIVTCILWIIVIFIVVKSRCATVSALMAYTIMKEGKAPENEVPTYSASDNFKSFMEVNDMICLLYFVLMAFVYLEASGCADMKSVLILTLLRFLIDIRATILEHPPPGNGVVLQFVIMMVMACSVYVLLVLPISTITALIAFILWAVVISTFVASRCNEILEQIRGIRTAVANMF
ncbi:cyclin-like F-box, partial [Trifolium medium]|nr:cyclin-like F-box [Trifolium medium]